MVSVDIDHPDIIEFIKWKSEEEDKANELIHAGYSVATAYGTVSGQNANHAVRVTDAFMNCLDEQGEWALRNRRDDRLSAMPKATLLWNEIGKAAWRCGDPGIQFETTINQWNTCPESGRINASNPCSEYHFLDDTACNLASLNLLRFLDENGLMMVRNLKHASHIWTIVLEISVMMGQFPSSEIAKNTWRFRTLGLGITGLGSTLLQLEMPYGSIAAQNWSASIMALITGEAYRTSAEIAEIKGPFNAYHENESAMLRVIHMHMAALSRIKPDTKNRHLLREATLAWQLAETGGRFYGFRNAQTTCIAPTGTISLLLDSETTGIEPYFSFDTTKNFVYGTAIKLDFPLALKKIKSQQWEPVIKTSADAQSEEYESCIHKGTNPDFLNILVTAMSCPVCHLEGLSMKAHIDMMAALQPFISGGISKTVNLPASATVKDVLDSYWYAYKSGLKSISIYRDGSKSKQPLKQGDCCVIAS
jgi:ribonucleoside-diphosphate reductase alpha chain